MMDAGALWLETDYFEDFRCKGGACRNSCCEGWEIAVDMEDYFRLIGMDCAPELHRKIECAFRAPDAPSRERYRLISPNWLGMCPLHGADGLCALQVNCGAGALPEICRVYPRCMKRVAGLRRACCSNSCEAVAEMLMRDAPLEFRAGAPDARVEYAEDEDAALIRLERACVGKIQDRSLPLAERIGDVCALLGGDRPRPEAARAGEGLSALTALVRALEENSASLRRFGARVLERYGGPDRTAALQAYRADTDAARARFPTLDSWHENLLANHFFYENLPRADARLAPRDMCAGLCALYGLLRALSAAHAADRDELADALAGAFRMIEHSAFYYNARALVRQPEALLAL